MKIPVTIVTGFLGSGKTTLICNLLRHTPDRRLAVLVNEFGEVSVDGALLRTAGEPCGVEIHDLPNGCICCTVQDDFLPIMKKLQTRKQQVDHILIETSGLALPTPVMRALQWAEIRNDFQLDAVLTVVDTPQLLSGKLEAGQPVPGADRAEGVLSHENAVDSILHQQLENADVVILNKIDDLHEEDLEKAEQWVRRKAPKVRFLELAYHAELDTRLCMGLHLHEEEGGHGHPHGHGGHHHGAVSHSPTEMDRPLENQIQFDGHVHSGLTSHEHGEHTHEHFHEHDTGWQSFVLKCHGELDADALKDGIKEVTLAQPILRAKGFAFIKDKHHRLVVQAVRTRVQSYYEKEHTHGHESSLVFIGYHPKRAEAVRILSEKTGTLWE